MKSLLLMTETFPYAGERFISYEIPYLAKAFERVDILPITPTPFSEQAYELPHNVRVHKDLRDALLAAHQRERVLRRCWRFEDLALVGQEAWAVRPRSLKRTLEAFKSVYILRELLRPLLGFHSHDVYYSYWCNAAAAALALLPRPEAPSVRVARAHGYDVYAERQGLSRNVFQRHMIEGLDHIWVCSRQGQHYLQQKFVNAQAKISHAHLGVCETKSAPRPQGSAPLNILSIASLVPVKRLHVLVEALAQVTSPVAWTHVGDGPLRGRLETWVKGFPSHVSVRLLGQFTPRQVDTLMDTQAFSLMVNTSESEGVPVSLMEAMARGVPCCAPDVGGVSELVTHDNGFLLPASFQPQDLAAILNQAPHVFEAKRAKAQETQRRYFNAEIQFPAFISELRRLWQGGT